MTDSSRKNRPKLKVYENRNSTPKAFTLTQDLTTIGRQKESTLHFPIYGVSRKHAHIERTAEGHTITDLGSHNGTFVNGRPLTANKPYRLQDNDVIHLGEITSTTPKFVYQSGAPSKSTTPASSKTRPQSPFANSWAIVIGINDYSNDIPKLKTATNDARRLKEILEVDYGYNKVFPLLDNVATTSNLQKLLSDVLPTVVKENDQVLFYFAGHGIALDGTDGPNGYLIPQDGSHDDPDMYISMNFLHDQLLALPCRHMLLILDCCFAGAIRWSTTRNISLDPPVIHRERYERYVHAPAWQVLTSAAYDEKALDTLNGRVIGERGEEGQKHSPFASQLFRALSGEGDIFPVGQDGKPSGDGIITASELYLYLRSQIEKQTESRPRRQTPGLWPLSKHDKGEYIFLLPTYDQSKLPPAPELLLDNNPYRGLESYEEEHAGLFFGRQEVVAQLQEKVATAKTPLTVLVGASGTGKSSLVKAGLMPRLGGIDLSDIKVQTNQPQIDQIDTDWFILPPLRLTDSPMNALATWLKKHLPKSVIFDLKLNAQDHAAVTLSLHRWRAKNPKQKLLLVIDQFEELITLCHDEKERQLFMHTLKQLLDQADLGAHLVITLRSDFEPQLADLALEPYWETGRFVIPPLSIVNFREIIEGPAAARVLYFEPTSLVERLITDVIQTPGALPLLSFTLSQLYIKYLQRRSDNRAMTEGDYLALGGVIGALRSRFQEEYDSFDLTHQTTMQRILLRMVSDEGAELARRRTLLSDLEYDDKQENDRVSVVLNKLVEARLLVQGKTTDNRPYVEPAHDALVRASDQLRQWVNEAKQHLVLQQRVAQAAADWRTEKDPAQKQKLLWHNNPRLTHIETLLHETSSAAGVWNLSKAHSFNFNRKETAFIRASLQQKRKARYHFVRSGGFIFGVVMAIVVITAIVIDSVTPLIPIISPTSTVNTPATATIAQYETKIAALETQSAGANSTTERATAEVEQTEVARELATIKAELTQIIIGLSPTTPPTAITTSLPTPIQNPITTNDSGPTTPIPSISTPTPTSTMTSTVSPLPPTPTSTVTISSTLSLTQTVDVTQTLTVTPNFTLSLTTTVTTTSIPTSIPAESITPTVPTSPTTISTELDLPTATPSSTPTLLPTATSVITPTAVPTEPSD